jgi:hypothetical protein
MRGPLKHLSHRDLRKLCHLVADEFEIPYGRMFEKSGTRRVMDARRVFCLYVRLVEQAPYDDASRFLRLSRDGARMLALSLAQRVPFPYVDVFERLKTKFREYLTGRQDERKAASEMDGRPDSGHAEIGQTHQGST